AGVNENLQGKGNSQLRGRQAVGAHVGEIVEARQDFRVESGMARGIGLEIVNDVPKLVENCSTLRERIAAVAPGHRAPFLLQNIVDVFADVMLDGVPVLSGQAPRRAK